MSTLTSSPVQRLGVSVTCGRGQGVVALTGELDLESADALEREVRELRDAGFDKVVVDLRRVELVDSGGLRMLIILRNAARREGRRLVMVPGPRQVQRVFDLTVTRGLFDWRD